MSQCRYPLHILKSVINLKNKPLLGIMTISLGWLEDSYLVYLDLEAELTELGVDVVVFTPYGINWTRETVSGLVFQDGKWDRGVTRFPDVVYNRLYGTNPKTIGRLAQKLGSQRVYNRENRLDKAEVGNILARSKLQRYLPETLEYSWDNLNKLLKKHQRVILKPAYGHYGFDIFLLVQAESQVQVYIETLRKPAYRFSNEQSLRTWTEEMLTEQAERKYLVQQWIEPLKYEKRFFDLRLLLQRNGRGTWEVTAMMSRINRLNYFISNFVYRIVDGRELLKKQGLVRLVQELDRIGIETAQTLNQKLGPFAELSVDFLIDSRNQPWIIEVNGKPRRDLFEDFADDQLLKKIYLQPLIYGRYLALQKLKGQR